MILLNESINNKNQRNLTKLIIIIINKLIKYQKY